LKELLTRTITGIIIVLISIGTIIAGETSLLLFCEIIFLLGISELSKIVGMPRDLRYAMTLLAGSLLIALTFFYISGSTVLYWLIFPLVLFLGVLLLSILNRRNSFLIEKYFLLPAIFWLAIPLSVFLTLGRVLHRSEYLFILPLSVIILIWMNDTGAYLTGTFLGRNKMIPKLSPNKTWEGTFGGLAVSLLTGFVIFRITEILTLSQYLIMAVLVSIFGLLGDLAESWLKRKFNVKNSGTLLPGHGGVLDRFDSLLFAAPAVFIFLLIHNSIT
jgi:phosphatidate cytidylyltransferase